MQEFFKKYQWTLSDFGSGDALENAAQALAWEDALIRQVIAQNPEDSQLPTGHLHFYTIKKPTIILGPQDTRLKNIQAGLQFLKTLGYHTQVRAHGGLAIVCDEDILNVSYIVDHTHHPLAIDDAYEQMVAWVANTLQGFGLKMDAYEIADSYCPGKFDLVVNGQKIGGIAQRRFKTGLATSAYLSIGGKQERRAQIVKDFYALSQADDTYPQINPDSMTTLVDLTGAPLRAIDIQHRLVQTVGQVAHITGPLVLDDVIKTQFHPLYQKTLERNHLE